MHAVPAASVEVSPPSATAPVGGTQQLTATVRDAAGHVMPDRTVFWTSTNTAVASVDINGLVSAVGIGSSTITATVDEVSDISTITVYEVLQIVTDALADGVVGTAYSQALAATGGDGTYGWTLTTGSLPPGLTLDGSTGLITGTPAVAGNSMFLVQVFSGGQSVQKLLTISVS